MPRKQQRAAATAAQDQDREGVARDPITDRIIPAIDRLINRLKPFEVAVPATWQQVAHPDTPSYGGCFEASLRFGLDLSARLSPHDPVQSDIWLVHGEYMIGRRHAWVELPGEVVFDGVSQRFYQRKGYYKTVHASPWYIYELDAALMISNRMPKGPAGLVQLGDWHVPLKMPWADPENPTRIDLAEAGRLLRAAGLWGQDAPQPRKRKYGSGSRECPPT